MSDNPRLLLQDCHYKLFQWFARRVDARRNVRIACDEIRAGRKE